MGGITKKTQRDNVSYGERGKGGKKPTCPNFGIVKIEGGAFNFSKKSQSYFNENMTFHINKEEENPFLWSSPCKYAFPNVYLRALAIVNMFYFGNFCIRSKGRGGTLS